MAFTAHLSSRWIHGLILGLVITLQCNAVTQLRSAEFDVDQFMEQDPFLPPRPIERFFPIKYTPLWQQALRHPEHDLQRQTAETIAQAVARGVPNLNVLVPDLMDLLEQPDQPLVVRRSVCRALISLDARDAAETMWEKAQEDGIFLAQIVEPALAQWEFAAARETWRERVANSKEVRNLRLLAINGLVEISDSDATETMLAVTHSIEEPVQIRIECARAAGLLNTDGLLDDARKLLESPRQPLIESILAMSLLTRHSGAETEQLIGEWYRKIPPTAAIIGLRRMIELNPEFIAQQSDFLLAHEDAELRRVCCKALALVPTPERCRKLEGQLGDIVTSIRRSVRKSLVKLADDERLVAAILDSAMVVLNQNDWRSLEQISLLLGALDHEPAAFRLAELLDHPRPEVYVAAAWALRELQVPGTLPPMLVRATKNKQLHFGKGHEGFDEQQNQLFQAFGLMQYEPAAPLMRTYIPKGEIGPREAAIWGLGHIFTDKNPEPLVELLRQRLADEDLNNPEMETVKQMSAVSIGRMNGRNALPTVRSYYESETSSTKLGQACGWARQRMTGEPYDPPVVWRRANSGFFLEPIRIPKPDTTSGGQ